jgi:hypothetical protein
MAKRSVPTIASDFSHVLPFLKNRGIVPASPPAPMLEIARKIHQATFSLILWRFRLKGLPQHGRAFIEEIASDALQVLPQVLMGYGKTAKLLTRGIIENTLRHLYFSDHPIEFERMNRDIFWYMTVERLLEYVKIHPAFLESESKFDAINRLKTLYGELSAGIHGRTVRHLEMRIALNEIVYNHDVAKEQAELMDRCVEATNFLLAMFHRERMLSFQVEDRRIILRTMPARARQMWRNCA